MVKLQSSKLLLSVRFRPPAFLPNANPFLKVAQEDYRSAWLSSRFGSETDPDTSSNGSDGSGSRVIEWIPALQS